MSLRVLVTGASGLLGRAVLSAFEAAGHHVTGTALSRPGPNLVQVDLLDTIALEALIAKFKPQVVVHCAAERRPDVAEANPAAARKLNIALPQTLSSLSISHSFVLIYISTDYVFSGHAPPPGYEPNDVVGPTNEYGVTKELGEREVIEGFNKGGRGTVLRVPVLYGDAANSESAINCLLDVTSSAGSGKSARMDHWAIRYPTNVSDVARVLVDLSLLSEKSKVMPNIVHFSAQEMYTKYDICLAFARVLGVEDAVKENMEAVTAGPGPTETVRPKDCHLANTVLESLGVDCQAVSFESWWTARLST